MHTQITDLLDFWFSVSLKKASTRPWGWASILALNLLNIQSQSADSDQLLASIHP